MTIAKNMVKSNINKTRRLSLALSFSFLLYKIIESKISPKITAIITRNTKKSAIIPLFLAPSISVLSSKIQLSEKTTTNVIITVRSLLKK